MKQYRTFWDLSRQFPPVLCRLLAKEPGRGGRATASAVIALRTGLPLPQVEALSRATSWDGVTVDVMRVFLQACHCDFCSPKDTQRVCQYLYAWNSSKNRGPCWTYLRQSGQWKTYYEPLVMVYLKHLQPS